MSKTSKLDDWTKPAAAAIPKEGYFTLEQGRYGPTYPRTPACHGFTIIAKIKPGTEGEIRAYGKKIEDTIAASPHALAPLQLHYLRWVLFDIGPDKYFMYQGIFDTDFDKYTEDAVQLFKATGVDTVFEKLEGFPDGLEDERTGVHQVRARAPVSEFPRVRRIPVRISRRNQEGARTEAGVFVDARPDAVNATQAGVDSSMLELDDIQHFLLTRPRALAARYGFLRFRTAGSGTGLAVRHHRPCRSRQRGRIRRSGSIRAGSPSRSPGTACVRSASTTHVWRRFPKSFVRGWRARASILGDTGSQPSRSLGGRSCQP